jgi:hypothetical protein
MECDTLLLVGGATGTVNHIKKSYAVWGSNAVSLLIELTSQSDTAAYNLVVLYKSTLGIMN